MEVSELEAMPVVRGGLLLFPEEDMVLRIGGGGVGRVWWISVGGVVWREMRVCLCVKT